MALLYADELNSHENNPRFECVDFTHEMRGFHAFLTRTDPRRIIAASSSTH